MKKPDLLVFIGLVVILGAAITGMTINENQRPSGIGTHYSLER